MGETGIVREWHVEEGWGVIESRSVPGGCWVSFAAVKSERRDLVVGQDVEFEWESAEQDGFDFRALRVWPTGDSPVERPIDRTSRGMTMAAWDIDPETAERRRIDL
ncbi:CspA family cold shock protein [Nocardia transvalensis]|uniref:CspA family cold shock protein n=1 Tax=Nocardia transvalensis TaxID=37333 RepID=A0A7W9PD49_9NOCA|nr:hypothetical protein [Nocardia transvalensis]MBB5913976.1 CspA family cold shock protein [Nocardia transvalensis]